MIAWDRGSRRIRREHRYPAGSGSKIPVPMNQQGKKEKKKRRKGLRACPLRHHISISPDEDLSFSSPPGARAKAKLQKMGLKEIHLIGYTYVGGTESNRSTLGVF